VRYLARGLHLSTDSNFMLFEPLHETTRLSATEQVNDTVTTLYFEREPFAEIDSDFFDDEEEESDNIKILRKLVAPSNPLRETNRGFEVDVAVMQDAVEVFESDYSSTVESELPSTTSRCTSASSRISQSSTEFHMDNTFLGTTSARDFIDRVRMNEEGKATKKAIAQAWVLCVAAEHADCRSVSPSVNVPGISFITEDDEKHALSFDIGRRARLGRISLLEFKMISYDADGMMNQNAILPIYLRAAHDSQQRIEASKGGPADQCVRRISHERHRASPSPSSCGRRSRCSS
jgi:hypothetical protein